MPSTAVLSSYLRVSLCCELQLTARNATVIILCTYVGDFWQKAKYGREDAWNSLRKYKFSLNYIQTRSPYRAVNTLPLSYKNQSVNAV